MRGAEFEHPDRVILVITALSEERRSVLPFLRRDSIAPRSDIHGREYIVGDYFPNSDSRPWHIVLPSPTSAGNSKSAAETALSLALGPAFVFLLGVAGGFPKKTNMYDVVVAERVYDVDVAKIDPEGSYIPRPDQHKATSVLLSRAKTLQDMG
jgi:nucleoside phosphorylase